VGSRMASTSKGKEMKRKHHKLVCRFDYSNDELQKISDHQVKFAGGLNILDQLEEIGAIKWEYAPKDEKNTTVIAKLDITMP
jgi:hypothetical protein